MIIPAALYWLALLFIGVFAAVAFISIFVAETDGGKVAAALVCLVLIILFGCVRNSEGADAKLNVESRPEGLVLFVTGGTNNVQYQVWTPANNHVADTNQWYYWRHVYSRDFLAKPEQGEVLIYGTNTSQQPMRFFQIRGVLPD